MTHYLPPYTEPNGPQVKPHALPWALHDLRQSIRDIHDEARRIDDPCLLTQVWEELQVREAELLAVMNVVAPKIDALQVLERR